MMVTTGERVVEIAQLCEACPTNMSNVHHWPGQAGQAGISVLQSLLEDPLIQLVMRADHVTSASVYDLVAYVTEARSLFHARGHHSHVGCTATSSASEGTRA